MNRFRSSILGGKDNDPANPIVAAKQARGAKGDELGSIEVDRHEGRHADHREGDRHRLSRETVTVCHDGTSHDAGLINLSGGGAMISSDFMPRLWDRVDLMLGEGQPLECAVRWIRGDRLGLEFAHETGIEADRETRDALLLETIRRTFPTVEAAPAEDEPAPHASAPADSRRANHRHPLIWSGTVIFNHDLHPVRLRNISTSGALVESQDGLPVGVEVLLDLGNNVQQFATVGWTCGEQSGLAFTTPFELTRLAQARPEVAPQQWERPGFLDLAPAKDSPWAEEWGRASLEELRADLEGFMRH